MAADRLTGEMYGLIGLEPGTIVQLKPNDVLEILLKLNFYLEKGSQCQWEGEGASVLHGMVGVASDVLTTLGQEENVARLKSHYNHNPEVSR